MWYTIKTGDSLSLLAQKYLGSLMLFNEIYEQNKDILTSPELVYAGQKIWIPVDGKERPDLVSTPFTPTQTTTYENQSPYDSTFPTTQQQPVTKAPQSIFSTMDTDKVMLYGGIGLAGLAVLLMFTS